MFTTLFQVALGGALGSLARYCLSMSVMRATGAGFPFGTLAVNLIGCFAMGAVAVALAAHLRPLVMTGILGGFTTFSAFALGTVTLWERGEAGAAALYVGASVALSIAALVAGATLARMLA